MTPASPFRTVYFNPRPPRGGRPIADYMGIPTGVFQSTPSARRATEIYAQGTEKDEISIHALREEGDPSLSASDSGAVFISIHALREEGDTGGKAMPYGRPIFQSTPSARRATGKLMYYQAGEYDFNPRPPRGGRRPAAGRGSPTLLHFNPRPPRGGRPGCFVSYQDAAEISIHALREEGDLSSLP